MKAQQRPILICPNHITYIDSLLLAWAFGSVSYFICHFNHLPWNLAKEQNVHQRWLYRLVCFVGKCLLIPQDNTRAKAVLNQASSLLAKQEAVLVFPEGTRGQSERIEPENTVYGVGQLLLAQKNPQVLVVYLRGRSQSQRSVFPKTGEVFDMLMQTITPITDKEGRRAARDLSRQVIDALIGLEQHYFDNQQK